MPTEPNFFDRKIIVLIILLLGVLTAYPADFRPNDYATPSYIAFELDGYEISEDATNLVITVFRMGDFRSAVSVDYSIEDGTATAGEDFKATGGKIVFPGGQSFKTITIPIKADDDIETDETFTVHLSNAGPNAEIVQNEASVILKDAVRIPRIGITAGHGNMLLSWQPNGMNLMLQRSSNSHSLEWQDVPAEPARVDGKNVIEEKVSGTVYFYRLRVQGN